MIGNTPSRRRGSEEEARRANEWRRERERRAGAQRATQQRNRVWVVRWMQKQAPLAPLLHVEGCPHPGHQGVEEPGRG